LEQIAPYKTIPEEDSMNAQTEQIAATRTARATTKQSGSLTPWALNYRFAFETQLIIQPLN
jgi:hypothetical protein